MDVHGCLTTLYMVYHIMQSSLCIFPVTRWLKECSILPSTFCKPFDKELYLSLVLCHGVSQIREGLIKDSEGREVVLPTPESEEAMVEYQGMLVSGAIAQRRG